MPADDERVVGSDQDTSLPGRARQMLNAACTSMRGTESLSRVALHVGFIPVVVAGLLLGRVVTAQRARLCAFAPSSGQPRAAADLVDTDTGGVGGELPDLLVSAVVPHRLGQTLP